MIEAWTQIGAIGAKDLTDAINLQHLLLAPHDTIEVWQMRIVVINPAHPEPAWVMTRRGGKPNPRKALALSVPTIEALTLDLAQQLCGTLDSYFGVHDWPQDFRREGNTWPGRRITPPWERPLAVPQTTSPQEQHR